MFEIVQPFIPDRRVVRARKVPEAQRHRQQHPHDQRVHQPPEGRVEPCALPSAHHCTPSAQVERPQPGDHRPAIHQQRRNHQQQQHVLEHVRGKEIVSHGVQRRNQRKQQHEKAGEKRYRAPASQDCAALRAHPAHAERVGHRRRDDARQQPRLEAPVHQYLRHATSPMSSFRTRRSRDPTAFAGLQTRTPKAARRASAKGWRE